MIQNDFVFHEESLTLELRQAFSWGYAWPSVPSEYLPWASIKEVMLVTLTAEGGGETWDVRGAHSVSGTYFFFFTVVCTPQGSGPMKECSLMAFLFCWRGRGKEEGKGGEGRLWGKGKRREREQSLALSIFLTYSSPCFLRQDLSPYMKLAIGPLVSAPPKC